MTAALVNHRNNELKARARYANIKYDSAFKLVFGSEANKSLLIELLETLIPGKRIADLTFLDKEIPGFFVGDKKTVFDLYCATEQDESFIVEMQLHEQKYFTDRVLFYSTYSLREQIVTPLEEEQIRKLRAGGTADWTQAVPKKSYSLSPVYMVSILNFELPHAGIEDLREGLVSSYSVRSDGKSREQMTDALHFIFLELPRLKVDKDHPEACGTMLERIAFAFRPISFLTERPTSFVGEFFEHLFHAAELAGMTLDERNQYDIEMTTEIDKIAQLDFAMEKGRAKGIHDERKRIARQMLSDRLDIRHVVRYSGLPIEEIQKLNPIA